MKSNLREKMVICEDLNSRVTAVIIDNLILLPLVVLYYAIFKEYGETIVTNLLLYLLVLIDCLHKIFFPVLYGGTIGKRLNKMTITGVNGQLINVKKSLLRYSPNLAYFILIIIGRLLWNPMSIIIIFCWGVYRVCEIIVIKKNRFNRTIHDFIADTYVLNDQYVEYLELKEKTTETI